MRGTKIACACSEGGDLIGWHCGTTHPQPRIESGRYPLIIGVALLDSFDLFHQINDHVISFSTTVAYSARIDVIMRAKGIRRMAGALGRHKIL